MRPLSPALAAPPPEALLPDDHAAIAASLTAPEAFAPVFERHARELHRFLARRVGPPADDLLGELFVTAFERRGTYRAQLGDARPWLYGIATNLVRRHHRAEATRYRILARTPIESSSADGTGDAIDAVDAAQLRPRLAAALAGLDGRDRDVLLLLAWAQLEQAEVAAALDIPVGTVRSRLHRARRQLRPVLADLFPTSEGALR